jgi:hypothetical protein
LNARNTKRVQKNIFCICFLEAARAESQCSKGGMGFYRHKKSILNRHKIREWTDSVGHDKHYAGVCKKQKGVKRIRQQCAKSA